MPFASVRKIMQVGGSKTVALPPSWLEAFNLRLGDELLVVADGIVLIVPPGQRVRCKQVEALAQIANRKATKNA
jgi:antitoxin component of MazEF toxin-antitoxin module